MAIAYIALGSNLGDREGNLRTALASLVAAGVEVLAVSRLIETSPAGGPSQPPFLNGAARIRTDLGPRELLAAMKEAERAAGRERSGVRWGPREADLDLLLYDDLVLETEELSIPHPRMAARTFVLEPLLEVATPDLRDPVSDKTIRELWEELRRTLYGQHNVRHADSIPQLLEYVAMAKRNRFSLGLVPTMGAFHAGHVSLMRAARRCCDKVVVSLFVNPTQFAPGEDLDRYPRQLEEDLRAATEAGVDLVFAPGREEMFPPGHATWVTVDGLSEILCGASRPGHFRGVTTVVTKLFHLVRPDVAFFGRKDYQQATVLRRMVRELDFPLEVRVLPTVREADGLAMSSRNAYLSPENRERATALIRGLRAAQAAFAAGERRGEELQALIRNVLEGTEGLRPEYAVVVHPDSLRPVAEAEAVSVALVAARAGETRLIDNVILGEPE